MSVALHHFLKPLSPYLAKEGVSELMINKPSELWLEEKGVFTCYPALDLTEAHLFHLAHLIAEYNQKSLSKTKSLLSATLMNGERCQFVLPPACDKGQFVCAIRKPAVCNLTLEDWEERGAFLNVKRHKRLETHNQLITLKEKGDIKNLMRLAIQKRLNILIVGGTSTAKTTFLNSCLKEISNHERLITVEGVREVKTELPNVVHLLANEDDEEGVTMLDLLKVCFRLRPDRIFLSELRSEEAYPYLRACISGHPGSLSTLHADSIQSAFEQLCFMLAESDALKTAPEERLNRLIHQAIDLVVQMARGEGGERVVEDVYLNPVHE